MKVNDGTYVGSLCSLIVKGNVLQVVVSESQIDLLKHSRNYEFHFDDDGNLDGTGCWVTHEARAIGEKVERDFYSETI